MLKKIAMVVAFPLLVFGVGTWREVAVEDSPIGEALTTGAIAALVVLVALGVSFLMGRGEDRKAREADPPAAVGDP